MDPITATILAGVLWLILGPIPSILSMLVGNIIAVQKESLVPALVGWVIGLGWSIFVLVQVILHAVTLIRLI